MSRMSQVNPIVVFALIASLVFGVMALPSNASAAAGAVSGAVSVTVTVSQNIRVTLETSTGEVSVASARECEVTISEPQDPSGVVGTGVCYTIVQK